MLDGLDAESSRDMGLSGVDTVRQRLEHNGRLANSRHKPADSNDLLPKIDEILYYANEVSRSDN